MLLKCKHIFISGRIGTLMMYAVSMQYPQCHTRNGLITIALRIPCGGVRDTIVDPTFEKTISSKGLAIQEASPTFLS